jgi:hypothetical protein
MDRNAAWASSLLLSAQLSLYEAGDKKGYCYHAFNF